MNWVSWDGLFRLCEVVSIAAGAIAVAALIGQVVAGRVLSNRQAKELEDLKTATARQQERAASAEKELLEVKERTAPRRLTEAQRASIKRELQATPKGTLVIIPMLDSPETHRYALDFAEVLRDAGWDSRVQPILWIGDSPITGVILAMENPQAIPPWVNPLFKAIETAGVKIEAQTVRQLVDGAPISLVVAYKP